MTAARALLERCIDYAGLFPPAAQTLETTVRNYAAYGAGPDAWALGRLVLPAKALSGFARQWPEYAALWPISVVLGSDYGAEIRQVLELGARVDMVECRPARVDHIAEVRRRLPPEIQVFIEPPLGVELDDVLAAIASAGSCAKIRTGGITADAIPGSAEIAAFLTGCARRSLTLKATAGLHHAVRSTHALTYEAGAPAAAMHGYVNFFVAATLAYTGGSEDEICKALDEGSGEDFGFCDAGVCWRHLQVTTEQIRETRERFAMSFGSCSFEEPLADARELGWLR